MSGLLGLGACQMEVAPENIEKNLESMKKQIELIKFYSPWVKLVVTPELCFHSAAGFEKKAMAIPNRITDFCSAVAREQNIFLVPGSIYEKWEGHVYNASPVFDDKGNILSVYRKMYPWRPHEKTTSGKHTLTFDIPEIGRIGVCNCYDLWFPELIRDLVFKGARIILVPTSTGTADRSQEIILARAAAIQNQCFIVSVNAAGCSGNGESLIVDPDGNIVQKAGTKKENLIAMLDLSAVQRSRDYGVAGVTRPLASFFHEKHRFDYQTQSFEKSPIYHQNLLNRQTNFNGEKK